MLFFLGDFDLLTFIAFVIVAVFAFAYHEFGHALVADRLGDMTPRLNGRMTLNPFPHLSLVGMIMLLLIGFGWAVTPINPNQLRGNPRTSHAIVAIAGPASNFVMAVLFAIGLRLLLFWNRSGLPPGVNQGIIEFLFTLFNIGVGLNLFLIAFNLLPIPPLDGFWVLRGVLPIELAYQLDALRPYGMLIFLLVIFVLPRVGLSVFPFINEFTSTVSRILIGF